MIWANQICINQSNFPEGAHQIGFMKDIYEGAGRVLVRLRGNIGDGRELKFMKDKYEQLTELVETVRAASPDDPPYPEALWEYVCEQEAQEIADDTKSGHFAELWIFANKRKF
jgi:hypothetical protein